MKYFSMFSGIGGFEYGIQNIRSDELAVSRRSEKHNDTTNELQQWECVGYSEIDKYAIQIYEKHFNHKNYGDATKIDPRQLPDLDVLVGGFPCQAFSIAGKRKGFDDTRGTLFFDIARILKEKRPRHLVLENVKGLLSHDNGKTFQTIIGVLSDLGYRVEWQILNSKHFGVPQNRERVFIIGHLRGECSGEVFPITGSSTGNLAYSAGVISQREKWVKGEKHLGREFSQGQRIYDSKGISQTLAGNAGGQGGKTGLYAMRGRENGQQLEYRGDETNSLTSVQKDNLYVETGIDLSTKKAKLTKVARSLQARYWKGYSTREAETTGVFNGARIRRLTPTECERLQGFPDGWTEGISDTQRYKCLGNAVTTNVITAIFNKFIDHERDTTSHL